jgi:uncharacterized protein YndB with AHSA1/START domain
MERLCRFPERVFAAYTEAEQVDQWWGQRNNTTTVEALDVRPGGAWRFIQRDPDGNVFEFYGEYLEVSPQKLVNTFEFAGLSGPCRYRYRDLRAG